MLDVVVPVSGCKIEVLFLSLSVIGSIGIGSLSAISTVLLAVVPRWLC